MSELKQKKQEKNSPLEIIDIVYSDFLILKENESIYLSYVQNHFGLQKDISKETL